MNHQTYEEWLFTYYDERSREELSAEQQAALQTHLQGCTTCCQLAEAWQGVDAQLRAAPVLAPQPDFVSRWQTHLEADRQRIQKRQTLAMLGFSAAGAGLLLASLFLLVFPWLQSPKALLWAGVYRLLTLFSYLATAGDVFVPMAQAATSGVSTFWWIIFAGLLTELGVLWVVSYRLITNPRRITQ